MIAKDDVEKGFVNANAAVVFDIAEFAKSVHKEADTGPGGTNHFCQCFLGDGGDERFRLAGLSIFGHDEESSRQTSLAGVKELIDQIGLGPNATYDHELEKEVSEAVQFTDGADHLLAFDPHDGA